VALPTEGGPVKQGSSCTGISAILLAANVMVSLKTKVALA